MSFAGPNANGWRDARTCVQEYDDDATLEKGTCRMQTLQLAPQKKWNPRAVAGMYCKERWCAQSRGILQAQVSRTQRARRPSYQSFPRNGGKNKYHIP